MRLDDDDTNNVPRPPWDPAFAGHRNRRRRPATSTWGALTRTARTAADSYRSAFGELRGAVRYQGNRVFSSRPVVEADAVAVAGGRGGSTRGRLRRPGAASSR